MPYKIKGKCIYKKDGGAKVGCTKGDVHKYMAALHANANESEDKTLDEIRLFVRKTLSENFMREANDDYKKWKRKNVALRGIANNPGEYNGVGSISLGDGLYTAHLGNKEMARKYGKVYFVVNGRPKHPIVFDSVNRAEIWLQQNLYFKNYKNMRDFDAHTSVKDEILKLGYDGIEIKGREMVNFKPENVLYFKTEPELIQYYETNVKSEIYKEGLPGKPDDRKLGKSLSDQTATPYVTIFRAAPININEFSDKDYVTLSKKFAIEHAENNHVYHESPFHVIQALVSTKNVFDAYNPGEYFYSGPNKKAKEIYVSKGPDEYEGWDDSLNEEYGGPGNFKLPDNHKAALQVPKGGSSCASCKFLGKDGKSCMNQFWIEWNGGDSKLPLPADEYCSDWYEKNNKIKLEENTSSIWTQGGILLIKGADSPDGKQNLFATPISGLVELNRNKKDSTPGKSARMALLGGDLYRLANDGDRVKAFKTAWRNEGTLAKILKFNGQRYSVVLNNNKTPYHWESLKFNNIPQMLNGMQEVLKTLL